LDPVEEADAVLHASANGANGAPPAG
jgi:hypothetical protein